MKKHIQITCLLLTLYAGTAYAQGYGEKQQKAFEAALLDSAYKFELLKPVLFKLQTAYELRKSEIAETDRNLQMCLMQSSAMQAEFKTQIISERRKRRKWAAAAGVSGLTIGLIIGLIK